MEPDNYLTLLSAFFAKRSDVVVVWLYGSRAKGNACEQSDWDLAVAFKERKLTDPLDNRLRPELLALDLQRALASAEGAISVIDLNQAPTPLTFAAISASQVIYCADRGRQLQEEARVMSKMELEYGVFGRSGETNG